MMVDVDMEASPSYNQELVGLRKKCRKLRDSLSKAKKEKKALEEIRMIMIR